MADEKNIDWLGVVAAQARADASRARELRRALELLTKHESGAVLSFTTDFPNDKEAWDADVAVGATIKQMWPAIRKETMRRATEELDAIVKRYQPLLQEPTA